MTRPRPSIGPALAGAVDLSALKQRASAAEQRTAAPGSGGGASAGVEITEVNFETEVIARSNEVPVVVLLWSPRSDASVELADTLGALAAQDGGTWALALVNIDTAPRVAQAVAQAFQVQAVPAAIALAAGQPLTHFEGPQPPDQLRRWVDSLVAATAGKLSGAPGSGAEEEVVDPAVVEARDHLDNGDFDAALQAYETILAGDPAHDEAKGAVRQISFLKRATTHADDAVAVADASPGDIDAAFAAADVDVMQQNVAAAFNRLIALVRTTAGDDRARVRTRVVELFDLFDPVDPDVVAARRNLANALY